MGERRASAPAQEMDLETLQSKATLVHAELERQLRLYDGIQGMREVLQAPLFGLIEACQQLEARCDALRAEIVTLEGRHAALVPGPVAVPVAKQGVAE